jgi:hypothetical protein
LYHAYHVSKDYDATLKDLQAQGVNRPSSSLTSQWTRDPNAEFKKGIRHDALSFLVYKDEKLWDTWQQSTLAQVRAQDVAEVLDATYVSTLPKDIALFAKKQEFMYAVFEHTLQTDQGKAFVHQHEQDFDAQKIYSSLQDYSVIGGEHRRCQRPRLTMEQVQRKIRARTVQHTGSTIPDNYTESLLLE